MSEGADRRSVLTGLGALGVLGCSQTTSAIVAPASSAPARAALDLAALEARHGGRIGFAAHDTASNRLLAWRGDERFLYCSTFKVYLAAATLQRAARGEERLDRAVPVTAADMKFHAPVTQPATGSTLTVERLCQAVVEVSDNPAANILIREMGGLDAMRAFYRTLGDEVTRVDRWETELNIPDGEKDTTTPDQAIANLHALLIASPTPLSPAHRALLERWLLASPTGPNRIKAGVPAGWRVAHKTGTGGNGPTNDIGVIRPPSGAPVVLAVFHEATSPAAEQEAVIAEATRLALRALGHAA